MSNLTHNERCLITPAIQEDLDSQVKLLLSHVLELVAIAFSKKHDVGGPFDQLKVSELRLLARYMMRLMYRGQVGTPGFFYSDGVKYEFFCQTVKVDTDDSERNCHMTFFYVSPGGMEVDHLSVIRQFTSDNLEQLFLCRMDNNIRGYILANREDIPYLAKSAMNRVK